MAKIEENERKFEKEIEKDELSFKESLQKEKKVPIFIPDDPLNPDDVVPVGLNGVIYAIPRGKQFMVPESIYRVWEYSYRKTKQANDRITVKKMQDRDIEIID